MAIYNNQGELFAQDTLDQLTTFAEWSEESVSSVRRNIDEVLEKRTALTEERDLSAEKETAYFWTSYVLRRMGYTFSVSEFLPDDESTRVNFTAFDSAESFRAARSFRGRREFFADATVLLRNVGWEESLEGEDADNAPANDLSNYMRKTGVEWGILTNGRTWRLYHSSRVGNLDSFFEMSLTDVLASEDDDDFRKFWMVFSPSGLGGQAPVAQRLLKN